MEKIDIAIGLIVFSTIIIILIFYEKISLKYIWGAVIINAFTIFLIGQNKYLYEDKVDFASL